MMIIKSSQNTQQAGRSANRIIFIVFILLLLLTGVWISGYMSGEKNTAPKTVEKKIVATATVTPAATSSAAISTNPNITPTGSATTLSYMIPTGFISVQDKEGIFQLSYNPKQYKASSETGAIFLHYIDNKGGLAYSFSIKDYDGGSRHAFIQKHIGNNFTTDKTTEKSYTINNHSSLVFYDIDYSEIHTIGMVVINSDTALLINGSSSDEKPLEDLVQTLTILK